MSINIFCLKKKLKKNISKIFVKTPIKLKIKKLEYNKTIMQFY